MVLSAKLASTLVLLTVFAGLASALPINLAFGSPSSASATYTDPGSNITYGASWGNDGDTSTHWVAGQFTATWRVDLGSPTLIKWISVSEFGEARQNYQTDYTILFSIDGSTFYLLPMGGLSGSHAGSALWTDNYFNSTGVTLRYIEYAVDPLQTDTNPEWAGLAELAAYTDLPVPEPAAAGLIGAGLAVLAGLGLRRRS